MTARAVCLPAELGRFPGRDFGTGAVTGEATYQSGCGGGQIEGRPALAWLFVTALHTAAPI